MPGPISIQCPKCRAKFKIKDGKSVGKKVPCPKCKKPFVIEAPTETEDEFDDFGSFEDEDYGDAYEETPPEPRRRAGAAAGNKRGKSTPTKGKKSRKKSGGGSMMKPVLIALGALLALCLMVGVAYVGVRMAAGGINNKIDMTYLPQDADFVMHIRLADAWNAPLAQSMKENPLLQPQVRQLQNQAGINFKPEEIDSLTFGAAGVSSLAGQQGMLGLMPNTDSASGIGVMRMKVDVDTSKDIEQTGRGKAATHNGQTYYLMPELQPGNGQVAAYVPDKRTVVFGREADIKACIDRGGKQVRRKDLDFINDQHQLLLVLVSKTPSGLFNQAEEGAELMPESVKSLSQSLEGKISGTSIGLSLTDGVQLEVLGNCTDSAAAASAQQGLTAVRDEAKQKLGEMASNPLLGGSGIVTTANSLLDKMQFSADGTTFAANVNVTGADIDAIKQQMESVNPLLMAGMLGGLGGGGAMPSQDMSLNPGGGLPMTDFPSTDFPTTEGGLENPFAQAQQAGLRAQCKNNLRQIGLALINYHDVYNRYPTVEGEDTSKKPMLSWRVHILPYLDQAPLYNQFKLDEPWDSEHNKKLISKMPAVFACPGGTLKPGTTTYLGVAGEKAVFNNKQATGIRDIIDGTSNTAMVVDADDSRAAVWTKPVDFEYSESDPAQGLAGHHADGFHALFCDGSVHFIAATVPAETLKALFTMNGRESVQLP